MGILSDAFKITTKSVKISELKVGYTKDIKNLKSRRKKDLYTIIYVDSNPMRVSTRFWSSFCSLYNLGRSTFDLFTHAEVFERAALVKMDVIRLTYEDYGVNGGRLLSCVAPSKPILTIEQIEDLVKKYGGNRPIYKNGIVSVLFDPPFPMNYQIGSDTFRTQFNMQMPVDGFGLPAAFLGLFRVNGNISTIAISPAFKSLFPLGKEDTSLAAVLDRNMSTFNNEEGWHSFKERLEAARNSWASFRDATALYRIIVDSAKDENIPLPKTSELIDRYNELCGDPLKWYGIAGQHEMSERKARTVPVDASVYDLICFASELATFIFQHYGKNRLYDWVGKTTTTEYDLEGTKTEYPSFNDFFVDRVR